MICLVKVYESLKKNTKIKRKENGFVFLFTFEKKIIK